jgi:hypothetical protein
MDTLTLPLDHAAIERILPHRYPFLLVDRITEFEADKRIVGIKNVTLNERYLAHRDGERPVPAAHDPHGSDRPGRRDHDPCETGESRRTPRASPASSACATGPSRSIPATSLVIDAVVKRLRSRMGSPALASRASTAAFVVDGDDDVRVLGLAPTQLTTSSRERPRRGSSSSLTSAGRGRSRNRPYLAINATPPILAARHPSATADRDDRSAPMISTAGSGIQHADVRSFPAAALGHSARVPAPAGRARECRAVIPDRRETLKAKDAFDERGALAAKVRAPREKHLVGASWTQNPAESMTNSRRGERPGS